MRLFSNRWQSTSKCGKNISDKLGCASCATFVLTTFWRHLWSITEQTHCNMECQRDKFTQATACWNNWTAWVFRFVNFRFEIDVWDSRSSDSDDEIFSGDRSFLLCYQFLNGVFDNFLVGGSYVFVDFIVKSRVRKLPNCFFLVEVGAPNDCRAAFVGCFDNEVISLVEISMTEHLKYLA